MNKVMQLEDKHNIPFFNKQPLVIEKGSGVWVTTDDGKVFLDFTSGWAVTSIGHAHPAITAALINQSQKVIQNPNSGLTYSPARAMLLEKLVPLLPSDLTRVFFTNSGAESNDTAIKLARKITGRSKVITTSHSFHGRTTTALSVTGSKEKGSRFGCLDHDVEFIPFNDVKALRLSLDESVAAFIVEPIQGEGGVNIPDQGYLEAASAICSANGTLFVVDEIQTGFCRTGKFFATSDLDIKIDFLTMAKGLGGGFPIGAFAVSERVAAGLEPGDHGGTYCGNPLACAVASAVIDVLITENIEQHCAAMGQLALQKLNQHLSNLPVIREIRGAGLLICVEFIDDHDADKVVELCLDNGLFVTKTQSNMIRIFPALNVTEEELQTGLERFTLSVEVLMG